MGEGNKRSDRRVNGERQLRRRRREEGERKGDKYRGKICMSTDRPRILVVITPAVTKV